MGLADVDGVEIGRHGAGMKPARTVNGHTIVRVVSIGCNRPVDMSLNERKCAPDQLDRKSETILFHIVRDNTATIRELRIDFRAVKRKIEQHGQVVITDHGQPAYIIKPLVAEGPKKKSPLPDYYARLLKRQPTALSTNATRQFWQEERG